MSPSIAISILSPGKVVTDIEVNLLSDIFWKFIHEVKYDEGKDWKDIITFESYEDGPKRDVTRSLVLEEAEKGKYIVKSVNNDKENWIRVIETKWFWFEDVSNPFYRNSTK